jgi:cobalt/nickel transport system permease protein
LSGDAFLLAAKVTFIAHIPIMIIEGFVTGAAVVLISKVKPELLGITD